MNRYPGPRSFTGDDRHLFFGREAEKQELFRLIVLNDIVVVFGESGSGKTSLLQAGVCPELEERQYQPVFIRLNNTAEPPELQVCHRLKEGGYIPKDMPENSTLWEYFSRFWHVNLGEVYTPVVVFDQFEELFTLYKPEARRQFIAQFAVVANGRPPEGLSPEVATAPRVKFVFAIRSDFLYLLDELSAEIPAILRCRYQLRPLDHARAAAAITRPAGKAGDFASAKFQFSDAALAGILESLGHHDIDEHLSTDQSISNLEIAAFQLQLVCQYLETKVIKERCPEDFTISPGFYGGSNGIRQIIDEFYNAVLGKVSREQCQAVEKLLARGLIRNGRRILMEESAMRDEYGVSQASLGLLHEERLLNREARKGELYYEISHDTLVKPVLERFKKIEAAELAAEADRLRRQAEEEKHRAGVEKRRGERATVLAVIALVAFAVAAGAAWYAWEKKEEAAAGMLWAKNSEQIAIQNKAVSDSLAKVARTATSEARDALAKSQKDQINRLLSDAYAFRKDKRFVDAIQAYGEAKELAETSEEKSNIAAQIASAQKENNDADFERNRDTGIALKEANQCRAAIRYLEAAQKARRDDNIVKKALEDCKAKIAKQ